MLIAQAVVEYGNLSGGISTLLSSVGNTIMDTLTSASPTTWLFVVAGLLLVWALFFRRL